MLSSTEEHQYDPLATKDYLPSHPLLKRNKTSTPHNNLTISPQIPPKSLSFRANTLTKSQNLISDHEVSQSTSPPVYPKEFITRDSAVFPANSEDDLQPFQVDFSSSTDSVKRSKTNVSDHVLSEKPTLPSRSVSYQDAFTSSLDQPIPSQQEPEQQTLLMHWVNALSTIDFGGDTPLAQDTFSHNPTLHSGLSPRIDPYPTFLSFTSPRYSNPPTPTFPSSPSTRHPSTNIHSISPSPPAKFNSPPTKTSAKTNRSEPVILSAPPARQLLGSAGLDLPAFTPSPFSYHPEAAQHSQISQPHPTSPRPIYLNPTPHTNVSQTPDATGSSFGILKSIELSVSDPPLTRPIRLQLNKKNDVEPQPNPHRPLVLVRENETDEEWKEKVKEMKLEKKRRKRQQKRFMKREMKRQAKANQTLQNGQLAEDGQAESSSDDSTD